MGLVPQEDPVSALLETVTAVTRELGGDETVSPTLDPAPRPELGDYSSNAAMLVAKPLGRPPREVATEIAAGVEARLGSSLSHAEVAGPGFVNLFLADGWYRDAVAGMAGAAAPVPPVADPEDVIVEFVSANPTGPLTAASGRHAAFGDAVSRLLRAVGHRVSTEYYVNDGGTQVEAFGASIGARMEDRDPPENGYQGEYVGALADRARSEGIPSDDLETLTRQGVGWMLESIRGSLGRFGVSMDDFFSERSLYEDGLVDRGLERLREAGHTYEKDGALWLRTTDFGDDKDRVLVRSDGEPTYFGADVAYHADKIERGHMRLLDVLGADHHGYVARMAAAVESLSGRAAFEAKILQMIHLVEGGRRAKMSKRAGDIVTLDELVDDVGADAARFFLLQRSSDSTIDLDLDLARSQSSDNPVYYVQYAHARIQSILRKAEESGLALEAGPEEQAAPVEPAEKALIAKLLAYPAEVHEAAARRAPHRICTYATETAAAFHAFYRDCKVVGADGEGVESARLALCAVTAATVAGSLELLGIAAPDRM
jgi:arginyl-tRNA synthetase